MKYSSLISIAAVLILGLITSEGNVEMPEYVISLESSAFDDQYVGCEEIMKMKAKELLDQERAMNSNLNIVWETAEAEWKTHTRKNKRTEKLFEIAVIAYTLDKNKFYKEFNKSVRECCKSQEDYMNNFHFKAFHFYLTRAVQILGVPETCQYVYRGISVKQDSNVTRQMRFGQFASTSQNKDVAMEFTGNKGTLYKVFTCKGAPIQHLSSFPSEFEVLVPPYEVFTVSNFFHLGNIKYVLLKSYSTSSKFNCAYIQASTYKVEGLGQLATILFSGILTLLFQDHFLLLTEL